MIKEISFNARLRRGIIFLLCLLPPSLLSCSRQPVYSEPPFIGTKIVIDISRLKSDIPEFFTYHHSKKNINFFVIKINDKVLSFIDACASCYSKKLGYRFDNGYIVCRACNVRYSVGEVEKGFGGCFPIQVKGYLQNERYLIPVSELEKMADKF